MENKLTVTKLKMPQAEENGFIPTLNQMGYMTSSLDPFSKEFVDYAGKFPLEKCMDSEVRRVVTAVSTACAIASNPADAVTCAGCDKVNSGSRIAVENANLGSPHAIFRCVVESEITA